MRAGIWISLALWLLLGGAALAQMAPRQPVTLSADEYDALIDELANAPARWSFRALQMLIAKRPAPPPAPASTPSDSAPKAP